MRILFLTTEYPWPATSGGPIRTTSQLRILTSLREVERVTLLSVAERRVTEDERRSFAESVPKSVVLPPVFHPIHLWDFPRYLPRVMLLRVCGVPYLAAKWDSGLLRSALLQELQRGVDVVYIDHLGMVRYLDDIRTAQPNVRVVLDQHNFESDFFKQLVSGKRGLQKVVSTAEWQASARFEKNAIMKCDAVVAISNEDADSFRRLGGIHANVVPIVVEFKRKQSRRVNQPHFCYVGNLRWRPNIAGLNWFCREVWPKILSRIPNASFDIVGKGLKPDASGKLQVPDAWKVPGVNAVGYLESLEPRYERSMAILSPVFGGSGVRVKLLEGFRAGLPTVTTPDGAFGLPLTNGREALIAETPDAFADHVECLVQDEVLWNRVRECGYSYLEKHHSQEIAQKEMRRALGIG